MGVNFCGILNLEKVGFYYRSNLPQYCFITLAHGVGPKPCKGQTL
jgi:hypothetical protein